MQVLVLVLVPFIRRVVCRTHRGNTEGATLVPATEITRIITQHYQSSPAVAAPVPVATRTSVGTKFLDVRLRTLRERERDRILSFTLVGTKDQLADTFTKQLTKTEHLSWTMELLNGKDTTGMSHTKAGGEAEVAPRLREAEEQAQHLASPQFCGSSPCDEAR